MTANEVQAAVSPNPAFLRELEKAGAEKVSLCFQCKKCSNGCPVTFAMDIMPNQVMRMVQLGLDEEVLKSSTIWVCASCETCTTRCPNEIEIAHLMDVLRQTALARKIKPKEKEILAFHRIFLETIKIVGRLYEPGMLGALKAMTRKMSAAEMRLGLSMFLRGKLRLFPQSVRSHMHLKNIFAQAKAKGEKTGK